MDAIVRAIDVSYQPDRERPIQKETTGGSTGSIDEFNLWMVNFLVVAPVLSPQVATQGPFLMGFTVAHAV